MNKTITNYVSTLELQELQGYENMSIYPILSPHPSVMQFTTLNVALSSGLLSITEIDDSGSVPELKVFNKASSPVFLLDGEELAGSKQNRVVNTSILLKEKSETIIPVSCTEQGRWSYTSAEFYDSEIVMSSKLRARKSAYVSNALRSRHSYESDQGRVWDDIREMSAKENVHSNTGAMRDVYEKRMVDLDEYIKAFSIQGNQRGILVVINGKVAGLDFISREDAYAQLHAKLIKSYAMEAILERKKSNGKPVSDIAMSFLEKIKACNDKDFKSVGIGWDHRFDGEKIVGSSLQTENEVIHMSFFSTTDSEKTGNISSLSRRRRYRT